MEKLNKVRFISIGGILTALTVLFQSAPVFLPAIGILLSPFSTLPIAIAAFYRISLGIIVFLSSTLILILVNVQEAIILLFTTGPLGIVIGTLLYRKGILISTLFSGILLTLGMGSLTYIVGISAFGDFASFDSFPITILVYLLFSLVYVGLWNIGLKKFIEYLMKIKLIKQS